MRIILPLLVASQLANAGPFADISISVRQKTPPNRDGTTSHTIDPATAANPYMSIRAGWDWQCAKVLHPYVSVGHESSISTGKDYGINDVRVGLHASF